MKYADVLNFPSESLYDTAYWDNFLSDEQLAYLNRLADEASVDAGIGLNEEHAINPCVRSSRIAWLPRTVETDSVWDNVAHAVSRVNATYFQYKLDGFFEPGQITRYSADMAGHYDWHRDSDLRQTGVLRKLSCAILLNDPSEFTGGSFLVKAESDTPVEMEQRRGRMWCFPSWMLHKVSQVTAGSRKSLIFWVGGPPFR